ncbi:MAG: SGNH/GDSL hydrolase family protein [Chloroflexi bacterium]|nr:SGNH/GDSL hydrolase family protein [Chloroflexota bacterium]
MTRVKPHEFPKSLSFFTVFDNGRYQLGDYQYLQNVIDYYAGAYSRTGVAAENGWSAATILSTKWANNEYCYENETPLACEIRLNNPSLILIHFGTNDWTETYETNMRQIIEFSISEGIVPVLITKANRIDQTNERNAILRQLAAEYHIPVWDFDVIAATLPDRGLAQDEAHLSVGNDFDYTDSQNISQGYEAFNLTGLLFLDAFLREVVYADK